MARQAAQAAHKLVHEPFPTGPLQLTACIGHDGAVWAVLTDRHGRPVAETRPMAPRPAEANSGPEHNIGQAVKGKGATTFR